LGSLHGVGGGRHDGHGLAAWEEEVALDRRGRRRKKRPGVGHVGRKAEQAGGWLGRLGQNLKENSFRNKNWIFKYTKALEICTRRFRRNFDMGIFLNFSRLPKDFRKI
jgi:hypothetical protein